MYMILITVCKLYLLRSWMLENWQLTLKLPSDWLLWNCKWIQAFLWDLFNSSSPCSLLSSHGGSSGLSLKLTKRHPARACICLKWSEDTLQSHILTSIFYSHGTFWVLWVKQQPLLPLLHTWLYLSPRHLGMSLSECKLHESKDFCLLMLYYT